MSVLPQRPHRGPDGRPRPRRRRSERQLAAAPAVAAVAVHARTRGPGASGRPAGASPPRRPASARPEPTPMARRRRWPPEPSSPPVRLERSIHAFRATGTCSGYGADFFGIWDRQSPSVAAERFPRTDDGWRQAWLRFAALEPEPHHRAGRWPRGRRAGAAQTPTPGRRTDRPRRHRRRAVHALRHALPAGLWTHVLRDLGPAIAGPPVERYSARRRRLGGRVGTLHPDGVELHRGQARLARRARGADAPPPRASRRPRRPTPARTPRRRPARRRARPGGPGLDADARLDRRHVLAHPRPRPDRRTRPRRAPRDGTSASTLVAPAAAPTRSGDDRDRRHQEEQPRRPRASAASDGAEPAEPSASHVPGLCASREAVEAERRRTRSPRPCTCRTRPSPARGSAPLGWAAAATDDRP